MALQPRETIIGQPLDGAALLLRLGGLPGLWLLDGGPAGGAPGFGVLGIGGTTAVEWRRGDPPGPGGPLAKLERMLSGRRQEGHPRWPFAGGLIGYFGYEARGLFEELPYRHPPCGGLPDILFKEFGLAIAWDTATGEGSLLESPLPSPEGEGRRRRELAIEVLRRLERPLPSLPSPPAPLPRGQVESTPAARHEAAIRRALRHIGRGDVYQVNLARAFTAPRPESLMDLYLRMRSAGRAPFGGFLRHGGEAILSVSPERFLRVDGARVETVPVKGTAPRGGTPGEDRANAEGLMQSAKDGAELAMIVDILRNDLSRVCVPGTVRVLDHGTLTAHPSVHHLSSTIEGALAPGRSAVDVVKAAFPGGSITGAPRIRAMEIIDGLEPMGRGPYCGSMGYFGYDGRADLNILIRTLWTAGDRVVFQGGGGIVADSVPAAEVAETEAKVRGIRWALTGEGERP